MPGGRYVISGPDDILTAVRHFFTAEAQSAGAEAQVSTP